MTGHLPRQTLSAQKRILQLANPKLNSTLIGPPIASTKARATDKPRVSRDGSMTDTIKRTVSVVVAVPVVVWIDGDSQSAMVVLDSVVRATMISIIPTAATTMTTTAATTIISIIATTITTTAITTTTITTTTVDPLTTTGTKIAHAIDQLVCSGVNLEKCTVIHHRHLSKKSNLPMISGKTCLFPRMTTRQHRVPRPKRTTVQRQLWTLTHKVNHLKNPPSPQNRPIPSRNLRQASSR